MARKSYSEEFRHQAVDLYETTPGATLRGIVRDRTQDRRRWQAGAQPAASTQVRQLPGGRREAGDRLGDDRPSGGRERRASLPGRQADPGSRWDPSAGSQVFRGRDDLVSRFQFVEDHQDAYEVKRLCELMEVARSSYYAWRTRQPARRRRSAADAALTEQIRALHKTDPAMGSPRITASPGRGRPTGLRAGEP